MKRYLFCFLSCLGFLSAFAVYSQDFPCPGSNDDRDPLVIAAKQLYASDLSHGEPQITLQQWAEGLSEKGDVICWQTQDAMERESGSDYEDPTGIGVEMRVGNSGSNYFSISIIMGNSETGSKEKPWISDCYIYNNGSLTGPFSLPSLKQELQLRRMSKAFKRSDYEMVKKLVKEGANVNGKRENGITPLCEAVTLGDEKLVEYLVSVGADVNIKTNIKNERGVTPLRCATNPKIAKFLVSKGADINSTSWTSETLLHLASFRGNAVMCRLLVSKGCNINAKDVLGKTPIHVAAEEGHLNVVKFLFRRGADIVSPNEEGKTPLHFAAFQGDTEVCRFLVSKGCALNAKEIWGRTAIYLAAENGHLDVVKLLCKKGADINIRDEKGRTPYLVAIEKNKKEIADYLRSVGGKE